MILDRLANAVLYYGVHERLRGAFDYLASTDFSAMADGRYAIDGDNVFALAQRYETKPRGEGVWEAHRRYVDVQYMASGAEIVGRADLLRMVPAKAYSEEKDVILLDGQGDYFALHAGSFAVFFPSDAHMPCLACGVVAPVLKVVVKVLL